MSSAIFRPICWVFGHEWSGIRRKTEATWKYQCTRCGQTVRQKE